MANDDLILLNNEWPSQTNDLANLIQYERKPIMTTNMNQWMKAASNDIINETILNDVWPMTIIVWCEWLILLCERGMTYWMTRLLLLLMIMKTIGRVDSHYYCLLIVPVNILKLLLMILLLLLLLLLLMTVM